MMRSLYSGVSGLTTHQTRMDVIGNNIANVNTVAFKASTVTFSELMYQTTQYASGANETTGVGGVNAVQIGLGVTTGAITTTVATAGSTQTTSNPFDISLSGDSFFVVSDGVNNYFTRAGAFYVDGAGNLAMTSTGYNVMGWGVNAEGTDIQQDTVQPLTIMSAENMTYPPESTTEAYISGIIDKNDTDVNSDAGKIMNLTVYDDLGYSYTVKLTVKATSETDTTGEYTVEVTDLLDSNNTSVLDQYPDLVLGGPTFITDAKTMTLASTYQDTGLIEYTDASGASATVDVNTTLTVSDLENAELLDALAKAYGLDDADELLNYTITDTVTGDTQSIADYLAGSGTMAGLHSTPDDLTTEIEITGRNFEGCILQYSTDNGTFSNVNGNVGSTSSTLTLGGYGNFSDITVDFATSSMYDNNGTSTVSATNGNTSGVGTGRQLGEISGITIQTDGTIYASYDNGMYRLLGQIAVAEFANASGLEKVGDNLYAATLNSGDFDGIGVDISANGGSMTTGTLEMSNVDLSQEFADMIITQRGFQANSRIITVSDSMIEELVNLKR
ncbi:MAG: flagellar hook-basal body complex protein [Eubacteriales bacterium]